MKKHIALVLMTVISISTFTQNIKPAYVFGGWNFSFTGLSGVNRWIDGYNSDHNKIGGWIMDEECTKIHGLSGVAFGFGINVFDGIFDFTYTKRKGIGTAHYSIPEESNFILQYKARTLGFGYLFPMQGYSSLFKQFFGIHLDFSKSDLSSTFTAWYDYRKNIDYYRNFAFTPSYQVFIYPFNTNVVYFGTRFYWQMNMGRQDFVELENRITGNWPDDEPIKKMKSSAGNIGVIFQAFVNPFKIKIEKKIKIEDEPVLADVKLSGIVRDKETGSPVGESTVKIEKFDNGNYIEIISFKTDAEKGNYEIRLPRNLKYKISTESFGYEPKSEIFELNDYSPADYSKDFDLNKLKTGQAMTLKNIYFKKASAELLSDSYPELDKLYKFMNNNPKVEIEIAGHTSSEGNDDYNMKLSQDRAQSIVDYLENKGISKSRMISKGYGEKKPVADNNTEEGKILNRRVEFKIIKQ